MAKIKNILPLTANSLTVVYNNEILIPDAIARNILKTKYGEFSAIGCESSSDFSVLWDMYEALEGYNLYMSLKALTSEYNPLANVDINETITNVYGEQSGTIARGERTDRTNNTQNVETHINDVVEVDQASTTESEAVTGSRSGTTTTNKNNYPLNSTVKDNDVIATQDEATDTGNTSSTNQGTTTTTNTTTNEGTGTTTNVVGASSDTTITDEHTDTMTRHKVGNEGVSITTQFLIKEELDVRQNEVRSAYIKKFIKEYAYLLEIIL